MEMPLIISDADGRVLYKSRSVKTNGFLRAWERIMVKANKSGLVVFAGKSYFVKEVSLGGRSYLFFMDYSKMSVQLGTDAKSVADELFDLERIPCDKRTISLKSLVRLFSDAFACELSAEGIRVSVHELAENVMVNASPRAFVLSIALMARLSAASGRTVRLSFTSECGRITVFCDGDGSESISQQACEVLELLLYEVAASAGFSAERIFVGRGVRYCLNLAPLDIALLGFKIPKDKRNEQLSACYVSMFL